jgi:hypothetical protein
MFPSLALIAALYLAFGAVGAAVALVVVLAAFAAWVWLNEGGW